MRASAHEPTVVFVILFGCFGGCWVHLKTTHHMGLHILYLGEEEWKVRVAHSEGCCLPCSKRRMIGGACHGGSLMLPCSEHCKTPSYSATSEEAALQKLEEERHKLYQGVPIPGERWKVGDFLDIRLENIKASVRPSTWERYHDFVRLHIKPEVGTIQLSQLSPSHIQALYTKASQKGLAARTVHHLKTVLHTALADAITKKLLVYNPTEGTRPPKIEPKEMKTFSQDEVNRFFEAIKGDRLEALYVLAIWTGMRQGELLALRWNAVDLDARELSVIALCVIGISNSPFNHQKQRKASAGSRLRLWQ